MYNRCGPKSKNDLRVKSAAKSDAQCRVSRLPRVRTCTSSSSSSTRRGATIDSRESSADVDERWEKKKGKKRGKKKRKIPRSEARLFQRYTGISPSESYGAQIRYTISNSLDSDTRLGSQIQSTAATTSLLPPRFKVTSHRAAILFRVSKLFTRLHRNSGRFLCNF